MDLRKDAKGGYCSDSDDDSRLLSAIYGSCRIPPSEDLAAVTRMFRTLGVVITFDGKSAVTEEA